MNITGATESGRATSGRCYHLFDMYVPFQGATPYSATINTPQYSFGETSLPAVDASAARGTDGKLYLSLVNVDPNNPARVTVNVPGVQARSAVGRMITGPELDTHNTFDQPNRIQPVAFRGRVSGGRLVFDLPAKSVAVVAVD